MVSEKRQYFKIICKKCSKDALVTDASVLYCAKCKHTQDTFVCEKCNKEFSSKIKNVENKGCLCRACNIKKTNLKKYGVENVAQLESSKEKAKKTNLERYGCEWALQSNEIIEKRENTNQNKYGVANVFQSDVIKEKIKQTSLSKFGVNHPMKSDEVKQKLKEDYKESTGYDHPLQNPDVRTRIELTNIEKYGGKAPLCSKEVQEKVRATNNDKYGADCIFSIPSYKERIKETNREKYGVDYPIQNIEILEKVQETNLKNLGCKYPQENQEVQIKSKNSVKKTYGVDNVNKVPSIREKQLQTRIKNVGGIEHLYKSYTSEDNVGSNVKYIYKGDKFDSSWELAFWIYHKDKGSDISRNTIFFPYDLNGTQKKFYPDFSVDGKLIEIKGSQLINHFDKDKTHIKLQVCEKNNIEVISNSKIKYYLKYIKDTYGKYYLEQFHFTKSILYNQAVSRRENFVYKSNNKILKYHQSIWKCRSLGYTSPYDALFIDSLLWKAIDNQIKYRPDDLSFEMTMNRFSISRIAKRVSLFKPALAKRLVQKYLPEVKEVFDPFSGFSGRLLGTVKAGKQYIGQDSNTTTIQECKNLIQTENIKNCYVSVKDIFDSNGTYESLFTCSPYKLKETWCEPIVDLSCDEWIDECLKRFNCKKYLFVVDNTEKYKDYIVENLVKKSHFGNRTEFVILIEKDLKIK